MYNLLVDIYNPSHTLVPKSANLQIEISISLIELYDAESYARTHYECLTRPFDNGSIDVGEALYLLALVTYNILMDEEVGGDKIGDITEVEMLARKSLLIKEEFYGSESHMTIGVKMTLSDILGLKNEGNVFNDERKDLLKNCLANAVERTGRMGVLEILKAILQKYI